VIVRITVNVLRLCFLLALILGILFWTGNADNLVLVHMILGILVVLSLWVLGAVIATTKRGVGLGVGAFVLGLVVLFVGLNQVNWLVGSTHWVIQVIHLLLGLLAIGFGEMIAGRYQRSRVRAA
jgi:hypothetical protein